MNLSGFAAFALCSLKNKKLQGYFLIKKWDKKSSHLHCADTQ